MKQKVRSEFIQSINRSDDTSERETPAEYLNARLTKNSNIWQLAAYPSDPALSLNSYEKNRLTLMQWTSKGEARSPRKHLPVRIGLQARAAVNSRETVYKD